MCVLCILCTFNTCPFKAQTIVCRIRCYCNNFRYFFFLLVIKQYFCSVLFHCRQTIKRVRKIASRSVITFREGDEMEFKLFNWIWPFNQFFLFYSPLFLKWGHEFGQKKRKIILKTNRIWEKTTIVCWLFLVFVVRTVWN